MTTDGNAKQKSHGFTAHRTYDFQTGRFKSDSRAVSHFFIVVLVVLRLSIKTVALPKFEAEGLQKPEDCQEKTGYDDIRMAKKPQPTPKNFEEALAELEQILRDMESGSVALEESLTKYERGNFLITFCRGVLGTAEKQIELLTKNAEGDLEAKALES